MVTKMKLKPSGRMFAMRTNRKQVVGPIGVVLLYIIENVTVSGLLNKEIYWLTLLKKSRSRMVFGGSLSWALTLFLCHLLFVLLSLSFVHILPWPPFLFLNIMCSQQSRREQLSGPLCGTTVGARFAQHIVWLLE